MIDTFLSTSAAKDPRIPDEYYERITEKRERDLAYELFKKIDDGNWYSVNVRRDVFVRDFEIMTTGIRIGRIEVVPPIVFPKRLGFIDRLRVLFTGYAPI